MTTRHSGIKTARTVYLIMKTAIPQTQRGTNDAVSLCLPDFLNCNPNITPKYGFNFHFLNSSVDYSHLKFTEIVCSNYLLHALIRNTFGDAFKNVSPFKRVTVMSTRNGVCKSKKLNLAKKATSNTKSFQRTKPPC